MFTRSLRSIEADGYRGSMVTFAVALLLAGIWGGWFALADVAVVEVAEAARLEVAEAAHSVQAPVAGRVVVSRLVLGQEVKVGDVLVELDAEGLGLALNDARAKRAAFASQIAALAEETVAEERALDEQRGVAATKVGESNARKREAEAAAELAESEMKRAARLRTEALASESDVMKAKAEAEQRRAIAEGARFAVTRIDAEQRASETERRARLARLQKDIAELRGEDATSQGAIARLEYEVERRKIRSPIAGRLGEVALVHVGGVVTEGEKLGAIVPIGNVRVVAEYLPSAAVGRIRPGQRAKMRPDGFPWTQYGMLSGTVQRVASEPRSGRMRVELDVDVANGSAIPLQHGMPGTLEIEVERVTPAALVFRAAGRRLATPIRTEGASGIDGAKTPDRP